MKELALVFIYSLKEKKFLLFERTRHPNHKNNDLEFTLRLINFEKPVEKAIKRKIKNKLGLITKEVLQLNWGSVYHQNDQEFKEMNFIAFVDSNKKKDGLNWFNLDEFVDKINWKDNKNLLKKVLIKGINKELYFDKKEREN
ncbi:MAG: hypothetical protein Q8L27_02745 [archaeon]|nr:hypothetical protein [archaeon]